MSKCGFALLSLFNEIDRMPYFDIQNSLFDIRYSLFKVSFLIRLAVYWPAAALNTETCLRSRLKRSVSGETIRF